jgi:MFS family permease
VAQLTAPRWPAALIVALCQSSQSLLLAGISLFLPLIRRDLGMSFTAAGTLAASSTFTYALMQVPSGFLADRSSRPTGGRRPWGSTSPAASPPMCSSTCSDRGWWIRWAGVPCSSSSQASAP